VSFLRFLVSGAAGFIGSHLCDRLIRDGHNVIGIDNLITGSLRNIEHLEGEPRFELIVCDVTESFAAREPLDGVLHIASLASPRDYLEHPIETLDVGAAGTRNMLEVARQSDSRFLLASTSECYGDPEEHPQTET
jgi:dTDP-glucose 4,6-dehydratase